MVSVSDNELATSVYYKDTDAHTYLTYQSSQPPACKNSIPYSKFLRLRRSCSDQDDFQNKASEITSFFHQRQYPATVTDAACHRISRLSQDDALQSSTNEKNERVPVVLT